MTWRLKRAPLEGVASDSFSRPHIFPYCLLASAGTIALMLTAVFPPAPRFVWNSSSSAPLGLYVVAAGAATKPGDMVVARLPARFRRMAAKRGYVPINVPLVKPVAAYGGDKVCVREGQIWVNGKEAATRRSSDGKGRTMPAWNGCIRLHGRELFLLSTNPNSFDGRYFGVTDGSDVIGKARLLWAH